MKHHLLKNTSLYTLGNLLPKISGFILLPIYTVYMEPSEYGILSAMSVMMGLLNILLILSIPRSIPRLFFDYEDKERNKVFYGTIFITVLIIATAQLSLFFIFDSTVEKIYKNVPFYPYFKFALLAAFFSSFFSIANSYYRQIGEAAKYISFSLMNFFFLTGGSLLVLVINNNGAESILRGKFYGSLFVVILTFYIARKIAVLKFDKKIFKEVIKFSLPLLPANIFAWILNMSDRIFIEWYVDLTLVGLYTMGYQIAQITNVFGTSIKQAYDPWFFKHANDESYKGKISTANNTIAIIILFIVFFISLFAKDGIALFLEQKYNSAYIYVPVIGLSVFIAQLAGLLNLAFYQVKKTVSLMWIIIAASILNIGLNFMLILKFGAMGAAWATLFTFIFEFLLKYKVSLKFYDLMLDWASLFKYLVVMSIVVIYFNYYPPSINLMFILAIKSILFGLIMLYFYRKYRFVISSIFNKK